MEATECNPWPFCASHRRKPLKPLGTFFLVHLIPLLLPGHMTHILGAENHCSVTYACQRHRKQPNGKAADSEYPKITRNAPKGDPCDPSWHFQL